MLLLHINKNSIKCWISLKGDYRCVIVTNLRKAPSVSSWKELLMGYMKLSFSIDFGKRLSQSKLQKGLEVDETIVSTYDQ